MLRDNDIHEKREHTDMSCHAYASRQGALARHIHNTDGLVLTTPAEPDCWRGTSTVVMAALIRDVLIDGPLEDVVVVVYSGNDHTYVAYEGTLAECSDPDYIATIGDRMIEDIELVEAIKLPA